MKSRHPLRADRGPADSVQFDLRQAPGHLLRLCHQRSSDIFQSLIGNDTGLSRQQVALMITIDQNPRATQAFLATMSGFDRNTLAEMIDRLIRKGLASRQRAAQDARAYEVSLTVAGAKLLRSIVPKAEEVQAQIISPLPDELRPVFLHCLKLLAKAETTGEPAEEMPRQRRRK